MAILLLFSGCDQPTSSINEKSDQEIEQTTTDGVTARENNSAKKVRGSYIVVFEDDVRNVGSEASKMAKRAGGNVKFKYEHAIKGFNLRLPPQAAQKVVEALSKNPNVKDIYPDLEVQKFDTQTNATWGLDRSDQRSLPLDNEYFYGETGTGVTAYIIDTGLNYSHTDFGGRTSFGYDAFGDDGTDCDGHGTHVAGTVGGSTWGIAKNVELVSVRVLDCRGSGTYSGVIAGVDWVTANASGPSVANMSLGGGGYSPLDTALENSIAAGVTYVVAAGNSSADACNYSPARTPAAITVGSTTSSDSRSSFSNFGSCVDLFAPGSSITSAWVGSNTATATISGTSMASPHVAGVAALYLEANNSASPSDVWNAIDAATTKSIVTNSNTANNNLLYSLVNGSGGDDGTTNNAPTADFTSTVDFLNVQFADNSTDSDGTISSWSWDFGDGGTSTAQNPSYTYAQAGTYTVTLTVTDDAGATDSASSTVTVEEEATNVSPTAGFTFSTNFLAVDFTDQSTDSDGTISSWSWDFGDGGTSTAQNPSYTYAQAGTYTVTLTVTDDAGATDTATASVTVEEETVGSEAPVVGSFNVSTRQTGPWSRADVTWSVTDADSDLATVETELLNGTSVLETISSSVSGSSGSGSHSHKTRGSFDSVRITVTDLSGNTTIEVQNL